MIEVLGIAATCMILVSFTFNDTVKIRILNMIGSIMFVIYGIYMNALSVWLLNGACVILQMYKLYKHYKLKGDNSNN